MSDVSNGLWIISSIDDVVDEVGTSHSSRFRVVGDRVVVSGGSRVGGVDRESWSNWNNRFNSWNNDSSGCWTQS